MKITKAQLVQIIKEEADKFKKELKLKRELAQIETQLNEVKAGGIKHASDTAGYKYDEKFGKKGTHLVEIEDEANEMEELVAAMKTIAKACGLSGTIELDDEEVEAGEEGEEEVETDVIEPGDEEEADEEEADEEEAEVEGEEEMEEEFTLAKEVNEEENQEENMEESVAEEGAQEENVEEGKHEESNQEESKSLNESIEKKRMMQLAGLK